MTFGEHIRARRQERRLSLRVVARQAGIDVAYLSRVEVGKVPPSDQLLESLAAVLAMSIDELFLLAGRLPQSIRSLVEMDSYRVTTALRSMAQMVVAEPGRAYGAPTVAIQGPRAIEDGFPFEAVSEIAEIESWRKEVYRPIYHVHKWWAQRLGSVFRAAILGATAPKRASVMDLFYEPVRLPGLVVFDPFMGSGTTVGEAHKLGCTAIGRDINPVAYRAVRTALGPVQRDELKRLFERLQSAVGSRITELYRSTDSAGRPCDVLYFFWVMVLDCPHCGEPVDLFSTYQFAQHAYVKQNPTVQVVCPDCGAVFRGDHNDSSVCCPGCTLRFDPKAGAAKHTTAKCRRCPGEFAIAKSVRATGRPPRYRMYAKLVLREDGSKEYLAVTGEDLAAFEAARQKLAESAPPLPQFDIQDGYNTRQILNYGYRSWHQLFNDRQLLALSMLAGAIRDLPETPAREALASLFSGTLEFNNMFASYKGEGTGAVRHMFSHHILKPERMPIEAHVWGTAKSSGAFATLYHSRLLRALDYREAPFEITAEHDGTRAKGRKVFGISPPMGGQIHEVYPEEGLAPGAIYLSCGSSTRTDLPDEIIDVVITDPPFFDNVHYSELADFFFVWQELYFGSRPQADVPTTRAPNHEVQDVDAGAFAEKLRRVFAECHRVLKEQGLLVFSYHHSREEGWSAVARAVVGAGFSFVQGQPVKSEMSVAAPKSQAKEPIDLDVLLVCRKQSNDRRERQEWEKAASLAAAEAKDKVSRFNGSGRRLSRNDVQVVLLSQALVELAAGRATDDLETCLELALPRLRLQAEEIFLGQRVEPTSPPPVTARPKAVQLGLLDQLEQLP